MEPRKNYFEKVLNLCISCLGLESSIIGTHLAINIKHNSIKKKPHYERPTGEQDLCDPSPGQSQALCHILEHSVTSIITTFTQ